ncbi:hypothetical protein [Paraburkholderia sp. Ac-20347]|uniref:hypothetical protein n=1 Tax=Paraburkholderia sp. Ac-20347 TaxID=2703892 RepID=UPI00197F328E|nr:hypothetical protein [Paraburkholderia sp. Ac-20347]MBN3808775.1 hypothetical protein [Paraburkholderia sp. Ac-20347]
MQPIDVERIYVIPIQGEVAGEIFGYALVRENLWAVTAETFATQQQAVQAARTLGYNPVVAVASNPRVENPAHWRDAD